MSGGKGKIGLNIRSLGEAVWTPRLVAIVRCQPIERADEAWCLTFAPVHRPERAV